MRIALLLPAEAAACRDAGFSSKEAVGISRRQASMGCYSLGNASVSSRRSGSVSLVGPLYEPPAIDLVGFDQARRH
jgi:hypothetical protein